MIVMFNEESHSGCACNEQNIKFYGKTGNTKSAEENKMKDGQTQIYTGDGKGKTTAAMGLALRALGAGLKVYLGQFIKDMEYSELKILKNIPGFTYELYGSGDGCFIGRIPEKKDIDAAKRGLEKISEAMLSGKYDVVIADEINVSHVLRLVTEEEMLDLINKKPDSVELIFTGRGCPENVLKEADLVTEMKEIKHYYASKGLLARDGIER